MVEQLVPSEEITEFKRRMTMFISPLNLFKRADHWAAKMMFKPFWTAVASAAVGLYSAKKAAKAQGAASDAASREAALAREEARPWDVQGAFGSAKFDQDGRELNLELSAPWQSEYDLAMQGAKDQRGYIAGMEADPMAAGQKFYEQQRALYAPQQAEDRLTMEKRLLGQGMFGSTGGGMQMNALLDAQQQQDLQAQYAGLDQAQGYIDTYRGRSASDLSQAEAIGQMPQKYAETGRGIGTGMSSVANNSANVASNAAQARGASQANRYMNNASMFGNVAKAWDSRTTAPTGDDYMDF